MPISPDQVALIAGGSFAIGLAFASVIRWVSSPGVTPQRGQFQRSYSGFLAPCIKQVRIDFDKFRSHRPLASGSLVFELKVNAADIPLARTALSRVFTDAGKWSGKMRRHTSGVEINTDIIEHLGLSLFCGEIGNASVGGVISVSYTSDQEPPAQIEPSGVSLLDDASLAARLEVDMELRNRLDALGVRVEIRGRDQGMLLGGDP